MNPQASRQWWTVELSGEKQPASIKHQMIVMASKEMWTPFDNSVISNKLDHFWGPGHTQHYQLTCPVGASEPWMMWEEGVNNTLSLIRSDTLVQFVFPLRTTDWPPWRKSETASEEKETKDNDTEFVEKGEAHHLFLIHGGEKMAVILTIQQLVNKKSKRPLQSFQGRTWALRSFQILCPITGSQTVEQ